MNGIVSPVAFRVNDSRLVSFAFKFVNSLISFQFAHDNGCNLSGECLSM